MRPMPSWYCRVWTRKTSCWANQSVCSSATISRARQTRYNPSCFLLSHSCHAAQWKDGCLHSKKGRAPSLPLRVDPVVRARVAGERWTTNQFQPPPLSDQGGGSYDCLPTMRPRLKHTGSIYTSCMTSTIYLHSVGTVGRPKSNK